jgi:hypothetical protein
MSSETDKAYTGECVDCGASLVLYEADFEKKQANHAVHQVWLIPFLQERFSGQMETCEG